MNIKKIILISFSLLLLSSCFFNKTPATNTLFIQAFSDSSVLSKIIERITPIANDIIKKELGIEKDFDFFIPKKHQALTLYYVNDIQEEGQTTLLAAFDKINKVELALPEVKITPKVDFLYGPFGQKDELVLIINDTDGNLSLLNKKLKEAAHAANAEYTNLHNHALFDIAKSERYPYRPHIGLGRIRSTSIKQQMKDVAQFEKVFEKIQQNIKEAVIKILEDSIVANKKAISFNKLCVFDLQKRDCIKEL